MKSAFIFDMDGTLAETIPLAIAAVKKAFEELALPVPTTEEITACFGPTELGLFKMLDDSNYKNLFAQYLKVYEDLHPALAPKPFDGIESVLAKLKARGAKIAIVTGKSQESAMISLRHYNLGDYFQSVGCGGMKGTVKTARIGEILAKWQIPAEDVYYVGDTSQDVIDARAANITPLSVAWSKIASRERLSKQNPAKIFDTVGEFDAWVDSLA